jgi:eukaryotic-like serine/threonine-protein kinase
MEQSVVGRNAREAPRGVDLPDRYEPIRLIGVGGMATIWVAEDRLLRRSVAVKVLADQFAEQPRFVQRFEREARTAASLSGHPHIVTIYDVGAHAGRPFIVMQHLSGGSFGDRMRSDRPSRDDVLRWLAEAASALDYAHEQGVVHRDVKPSNLLFDGLGRLVVADFGIARAAFEDQLTVSGELLGTAAYISPEQTMGEPATAASDRYAFAVVAYEAFTGGLPFGTGTLMELAARRTQMDPPRPSLRSPELPPAVDDVLLRGLARDPAARWPTASELVRRLERALPEQAAPQAPVQHAPVLDRTPTPPPRANLKPYRARRVPLVAILLGLAAAAAGLVIGLTLLNDDNGAGRGLRLREGDRVTRTTGAREKSRARRPQTTQKRQNEQRTAPPAQQQAPAPSGSSPAALNDEGFRLMNAGRYADAIPVLQRAVEAFPQDSNELTYAYALYNLGRSLRLAGRPGEAIPFLERRLRFPNQRGTVEKELAAARRAAAA